MQPRNSPQPILLDYGTVQTHFSLLMYCAFRQSDTSNLQGHSDIRTSIRSDITSSYDQKSSLTRCANIHLYAHIYAES